MNPRVAITRVLNQPIDSNCYIIGKPGEDRCILVDPALGEGPELALLLAELGLKPEYIILTHEHFDHISSVEQMRERYECSVIASAKCSANITDPKKNLSLFYDQKGFSCAPADLVLEMEEQAWEWRDIPVHFFYTPGHSEGGICFSIDDNLFTGDTLMSGYKPVTKLPGGSRGELERSVRLLIDKFGSETNVFPGHGAVGKLSAFKL